MTFLPMAWRNVFRNVRRSVITALAITVGTAALVFIWAYVDGINRQMIENSTGYLSGHIQIHRTGYHEDPALDLAFEDMDALRARLRDEPTIDAVTPRVEGEALISGEEKSRGILVIGVDPEQELRVTTLARAVTSGTWLSANERDSILVGEQTAEVLGVSVGSDVTLITQAVDGSIAAGRYRVTGIFDTGIQAINGAYVFLPLAAAQNLYALGDGATALVARLNRLQAAPETAARVGSRLGGSFEVLGWEQLLPSVVQDVKFHEIFTLIVLVVVFSVVALGIANTILMGVMERVREFGVMMAVGTTPIQILRLVLQESVLLGLFGLVLGNALGVAVTLYFARYGMDLGRYVRAMETMPGLSGVVYPLVRVDHLLMVSTVVLAVAFASALVPALKAARLQPVDAIRGLRRAAGPGRMPAGLPLVGSMFVTMAVRSLLRNPRRTLLTLSATAIGLASFLFLSALADGFFEQMIDNSTGYVAGHLQIQRPGFREEMDPARSINAPDDLLAVVRRDPRVAAAAPRIQAPAMASSAVQSEGILLFGVDPTVEPAITRIGRAVREGSYLRPGDDRGIIIGRKLADRLGVALGEKMVVVAQAADGTLGSGAFRVVGLFTTGNGFFDRSLAFLSLGAAQTLLALEGKASAIVVASTDQEEVRVAARFLKDALAETPYEVFTWEELLPEVVQMIALVKMNVVVVLAILFGVVALGVMNTILMSVMERTREFGIMMALGTRPSRVLTLVVYESAILGAIGVLVGYGLGWAVVGYFGARGVDFSAYLDRIEGIPGLTGIIYPTLIPAHVLVPSFVLFLTSCAASVYPAWRGARLDPMPAIRHV